MNLEYGGSGQEGGEGVGGHYQPLAHGGEGEAGNGRDPAPSNHQALGHGFLYMVRVSIWGGEGGRRVLRVAWLGLSGAAVCMGGLACEMPRDRMVDIVGMLRTHRPNPSTVWGAGGTPMNISVLFVGATRCPKAS